MICPRATGSQDPVLVVNEADTSIRITRNLLAQLGVAAVDEASSGAAAVAKLRRRRYRAIIADRGALAQIEAAGAAGPALLIAAARCDAEALKRQLAPLWA